MIFMGFWNPQLLLCLDSDVRFEVKLQPAAATIQKYIRSAPVAFFLIKTIIQTESTTFLSNSQWTFEERDL